MRISTSIFGVIKPYGMEEGLKMLKEAGFEAIDYSITQNAMDWEEEPFIDPSSPAFAEHFKKIAKTVRDSGLEMHQCHAPYAKPTFSDPEFYARLQKQIIRSVYAAAYMECPYIVAHPVLDVAFCHGQNKELARQTSLDYFSAIAPVLQETGVTMCIENLFFYIRETKEWAICYGSTGEELRDLIDTLNEMHGSHFAACVDTGHAVVAGQDPAEIIRTLGSRIKVLHIQDNLGVKDEHLIPTEGKIDWKSVAEALHDVGYTGTFNFEVMKPFDALHADTFSRETFQCACKYLYLVGRSLADLAEGKSL